MEDWMAQLQQAGPEAAWDLFLDRYRRLIFAAIRHYAQDYDDVMDVFARVCEALREDDLRRLRTYVAQPDHRARFSTWLVTVVRHVTVDWFRHRDGRRRLSVVADGLPPGRRLSRWRRPRRVPTTSLTRAPCWSGRSARSARRTASRSSCTSWRSCPPRTLPGFSACPMPRRSTTASTARSPPRGHGWHRSASDGATCEQFREP